MRFRYIYPFSRLQICHNIVTLATLSTLRILPIIHKNVHHYCFHGRLSRSTFPPHSITPTFFISCAGSALNFSDNTAATPTAAEDSIMSFIRSQISLIAEIISSSVTVMTSVTLSRMIGQVLWPRQLLSPSATALGEPHERETTC